MATQSAMIKACLKYDAMGLDVSDILADVLKLDAVEIRMDKPCGKSHISDRKKCSPDKLTQLTADLKAGDEGAKRRVAEGKKSAQRKQQLSRAVQRDKGKKPVEIEPAKPPTLAEISAKVKHGFESGDFAKAADAMNLGHAGEYLAPHEASRLLSFLGNSIYAKRSGILKAAKELQPTYSGHYATSAIKQAVENITTKTKRTGDDSRLSKQAIDKAKKGSSPDDIYVQRLNDLARSYSASAKEKRTREKEMSKGVATVHRRVLLSSAQQEEREAQKYKDALLKFAKTGEIVYSSSHPKHQ